MNIQFHILNASGKLDPYTDLINKTCNETREKVTAKIPIDNVDIVLADTKYRIIPEIGIGGFTINRNLIEISFDSNFPNFKQTLDKNLIGTLAHELHHTIRMGTIGYGKKLLDGIVTEGLADHFADEITGKKSFHPWSKALNSDQVEKFLKRAIVENDKEYDHNAWFFGSQKEIPRWAGYTLGFHLVEIFLQTHPKEKASTLYKTKTEEFL